MDISGHDRIGGAELIPDLGVLIASLFLPKFFSKYSGTPQYKEVAKTLSEQFMPHKDGKGYEEEILLAEVVMLLEPASKQKFEEMLRLLTRGEKQFLAGAIALFAAKYQKEKKQTQKSSDGKDSGQTIASLEPLTQDNPAIKFLEQTLNGEERSVEQTIELLRSKNMIRESVAGKLQIMFKQYKDDKGQSTEDVIQSLMKRIEDAQVTKIQAVGPLGLLFAILLGRWGKVELIFWKEAKHFVLELLEQHRKRKENKLLKGTDDGSTH